MSFSDLVGPKRPKEIAFPRQIAMYLVRELLGTVFRQLELLLVP
ncbi:helix-turn-helix domain-containing protein [Lactococcus lactis subsp. lactis]